MVGSSSEKNKEEKRGFSGNGKVGYAGRDRGRGCGGKGMGGYGGRGHEYDGGMGGMGDVRDYMYGPRMDVDRMGVGGPVGECWSFMRGNCKFGVHCRFKHVMEDA